MNQNYKYYSLIAMAFSLMTFNVIAQIDVQNLYEQNCLVCHGDDGSGAMPGIADLTVNRGWSTMNEIKLVERLKQGIQTPGAAVTMPPKGGNPYLSDNDLKALIYYMRTEFLE